MSNSNQYLILPEYNSEIVYQELLPKLQVFSQNIEGNISLWREHMQFFLHFAETVHHFHLPEIHDNIIENLFTLIQSGNNHLRQAIAKLLAAIIVNQYDPERRQTLSDQIVEQLAEGSAFHMRKTFVYFCKECAGKLISQYFLDKFYEQFLKMSDDKVPSVRLEFSKALPDIKPYVDAEQERDF
jgi:hypothetical protein